MSRRYALLTLPLLLAAGCAQMSPDAAEDPASSTPAARFAGSVEASDHAMETAIGRMDAFERLAAREDNAIGYAVGSNTAPQLLPAGSGVAETTGRVLAPAFTALGDYGHILAQAAARQPIQAKQSPPGADLAAAAGKALDELATTARVTVPPAVRTAGLAAIATLADLPEQLTKNHGSRPSLAQVVGQAEPQVKALVVMLQTVVGASPEAGVRNVIRTRRMTLDAAQTRFLAAVRADRTAGPADRYAIFRTVAELREGDPAQGTLAQVHSLLGSLGQAHDALDDGAADADAKVAGFEGSVDRLMQLGEQARRAAP